MLNQIDHSLDNKHLMKYQRKPGIHVYGVRIDHIYCILLMYSIQQDLK